MRGARPLGVQAYAQHIDWRLQQFGGDAHLQQRTSCGVVKQQVPVPVDRERRKRLVRLQDLPDRRARRRHRRVVQRAFGVHRREAGGREQAVAFAQRHVEPIGQAKHHFAARHRAAGLDEAEVARRNLGIDREVEPAQPAALAPFAQLRADGEGVSR